MKRTAYLLAFGLACALAQPCSSLASAPAKPAVADAPKPEMAPVKPADRSNVFEYRFDAARFTVDHVTIADLVDRKSNPDVKIWVQSLNNQPGRFITANTYVDDHPATRNGAVLPTHQPNTSVQLSTPPSIPLFNYISYIDNRQRLKLKAPGEYQASTFIPNFLNKRRYKFFPC